MGEKLTDASAETWNNQNKKSGWELRKRNNIIFWKVLCAFALLIIITILVFFIYVVETEKLNGLIKVIVEPQINNQYDFNPVSNNQYSFNPDYKINVDNEIDIDDDFIIKICEMCNSS